MVAPARGARVGEPPRAPANASDPKEAGIRVLFTHPWFWPHVRRGAEREIHDLGTGLAARGHAVRLVTTTPTGVTRHERVDGVDVRYVRTPVPRPLARRGLTTETAFAGVAAAAALASRADVVHAFLYGDGYGAGQARRLRDRPLVLKLTGTVLPERIAALPIDDRMFRSALHAADEVWCNSAFARDQMAGFGVPMQIVPAGIDTSLFRPVAPRWPDPTVLVASAPTEPRKRLVDLFDAWPEVVAACPDARLRCAGAAPTGLRTSLLDRLPAPVRGTVRFLGSCDTPTLVAEYAAAWACAAPAVHEALGLTTLEAMACGTPVAGADSGATSELVTEGATGTLFAPADPTAAADAILRAIELGRDPATATRCREAADAYAWGPIVAQVEARYRTLVAGRSGGGGTRVARRRP